jgi:NIMA (never in mitosis gene a)-related kinase 1/4/5
MNLQAFTRVKSLGKGSFGEAILVKRNTSGELFVLKEIWIGDMDQKGRTETSNEVRILQLVKHPNIVAYHGSFEEDGKLYIVMDYADGGDLSMRINSAKTSGLLTEDEIMYYFMQLALSMKHIHDKNILHRDLKTQNIFLTKEGVVKLGDFGISKVLNSETEMASTVIGTPYYLSPELCEDMPYNHKSDIWALGCVLYELTTLKHAFDGRNLPSLVLKILQGKYPSPPETYSIELRGLIDSMLQTDPGKRPSADQLIAMPFIRNRIMAFVKRTQDFISTHHAKSIEPPSCSSSSSLIEKEQETEEKEEKEEKEAQPQEEVTEPAAGYLPMESFAERKARLMRSHRRKSESPPTPTYHVSLAQPVSLPVQSLPTDSESEPGIDSPPEVDDYSDDFEDAIEGFEQFSTIGSSIHQHEEVEPITAKVPSKRQVLLSDHHRRQRLAYQEAERRAVQEEQKKRAKQYKKKLQQVGPTVSREWLLAEKEKARRGKSGLPEVGESARDSPLTYQEGGVMLSQIAPSTSVPTAPRKKKSTRNLEEQRSARLNPPLIREMENDKERGKDKEKETKQYVSVKDFRRAMRQKTHSLQETTHDSPSIAGGPSFELVLQDHRHRKVVVPIDNPQQSPAPASIPRRDTQSAMNLGYAIGASQESENDLIPQRDTSTTPPPLLAEDFSELDSTAVIRVSLSDVLDQTIVKGSTKNSSTDIEAICGEMQKLLEKEGDEDNDDEDNDAPIATASLVSLETGHLSLRIEELRHECETGLGADVFLHLYRILKDSNVESSSDGLQAFAKLSSKEQSYVRKVSQLIFCEDKFYA